MGVTAAQSVMLSAGTYSGGTAAIAAHPDTSLKLGDLLDHLGNTRYAYFDSTGTIPFTGKLEEESLTGTVTVGPCTHAYTYEHEDGATTHSQPCPACGDAASGVTCSFDESGKCPCGAVLAVTLPDHLDLTYTGAAQTPEVTVTVDGITTLEKDTHYSVAYANNTDAGDNASVTVTGQTFSGTVARTFSIGKATLTAQGSGTASGIYGTKLSELAVSGNLVVHAESGAEVAGRWTPIGETIPGVGDTGPYEATFMPAAGAGSYNPLTAQVTLSISKAPALPPKTGNLAVANKQARTYTYGLGALCPDVPEGMSLGNTAVTYELGTVNLGGYYTAGAKIEGQTLTLPIEAVESGEETKIGTITLIIHSENFEDMTATIQVRSDNKIIPTGGPTLSANTLTYGQALNAITLSGSMQDNGTPVPGRFAWSSPGNRPAVQESCAAAWTFTPDDSGAYAIVAGTVSIQVLPAPIADAVIVLDPAAFRYDGAPHRPGIAAVTLNDTPLTADVDYTAVIPEGTKAGTYTVTITGKGSYTGTAAAAFTINPVEQKPLEQKDDAGNVLRLEIETGLSAVPEALKENAELNTPRKLETAMRAEITQAAPGIPQASTAVYDVTLTVSADGGATWTLATKDNFPAAGLTITLPYPAGTNSGYRFTVVHMFTTSDFGKRPGTTEVFTPNQTTNLPTGIQVTVTGLSPISIGWTAPSTIPDAPSSGGQSGGGGGSGSRPANKQPLPEAKRCDGGANCPSRGFHDLGTIETWYHEAVDYALQNGLMSGYSSGTFGPDDNLTRAQLVQILYNKEGQPSEAYRNNYTDVPANQWYAPAVAWASARGIAGGYGNGRFGPDDFITREQLAVMLWRYAGTPTVTGQALPFEDAGKANGYGLAALRWAVETGILNGKGNGILDPQGLATRAQAAQMLMNFIEKP